MAKCCDWTACTFFVFFQIRADHVELLLAILVLGANDSEFTGALYFEGLELFFFEPLELLWLAAPTDLGNAIDLLHGVACAKVATPLPHVLILVNTKDETALTANLLEVGTLGHCKPFKHGGGVAGVVPSNIFILTGAKRPHLARLAVLAGYPDVAVALGAEDLLGEPAFFHFELIRVVFVVLVISAAPRHAAIEHVATGVGFAVLGHDRRIVAPSADVNDAVTVVDAVEVVPHLHKAVVACRCSRAKHVLARLPTEE
mmetsp:Transcript_23102/g.28635  ORF Transcript_23102/g.28635 Transcript_23102/m.28635 type:complete len:258 (-) Transcript_23102:6992-7765(-)